MLARSSSKRGKSCAVNRRFCEFWKNSRKNRASLRDEYFSKTIEGIRSLVSLRVEQTNQVRDNFFNCLYFYSYSIKSYKKHTWEPSLLWRTSKVQAASCRTFSFESERARLIVGPTSAAITATISLLAADMTSERPMQTPCRCSSVPVLRPLLRIGMSLGRMRSPSFFAKSPRVLDAIERLSSCSEAKFLRMSSMRIGSTSRIVRAVLLMSNFQTWRADDRTLRAMSFLNKILIQKFHLIFGIFF